VESPTIDNSYSCWIYKKLENARSRTHNPKVAGSNPAPAIEIGSRRLLHVTVTAHPTAAWTLQQFREILAAPHAYRFILHDRDSIYVPGLDAAVTAMGVRVLRTPVQAPVANPCAERLIGSIRRECLDQVMVFSEGHLRRLLTGYFQYYYRGPYYPTSLCA
jgi:hypothetical protein